MLSQLCVRLRTRCAFFTANIRLSEFHDFTDTHRRISLCAVHKCACAYVACRNVQRYRSVPKNLPLGIQTYCVWHPLRCIEAARALVTHKAVEKRRKHGPMIGVRIVPHGMSASQPAVLRAAAAAERPAVERVDPLVLSVVKVTAR